MTVTTSSSCLRGPRVCRGTRSPAAAMNAADSQRSFPRFRRRYSVSSRRKMTQEKNLRISKFPFQALSCKGSRWPWKTKGRRKRSRSPRRNQCMSCWDLGGIGTHAGAICPDPARIPAEYAVVRLLTSSPTLFGTCRSFFQSGDGFQSADPRSFQQPGALSFQLLLGFPKALL